MIMYYSFIARQAYVIRLLFIIPIYAAQLQELARVRESYQQDLILVQQVRSDGTSDEYSLYLLCYIHLGHDSMRM